MQQLEIRDNVMIYRKLRSSIAIPTPEQMAEKRRQLSNQEKKQKEQKWLNETKQQQFKMENAQKNQIIGVQQVEQEQIQYIKGRRLVVDIINQLKRQKTKYIDPQFPPNQFSLCGKINKGQCKKISWEKISSKLKNPLIFDKLIEPKDINQGSLGDCYFLSTLAALAQVPDRIRNLFIVQNINDYMFFAVKILHRGIWQLVYLDQMIPFNNVRNIFAFSKPNQSQLWVVLLEKAWAKLYKSYSSIEDGDPEEALHDLTGAPVINYRISKYAKLKQKRKKLWSEIIKGTKRVFPMVACSIFISGNNNHFYGIQSSHAYTLLQAVQINCGNTCEKLIQLRNPWGKAQYNGRWSDNDPIWQTIPSAERKRVGYFGKVDDGIFYIPFREFMKVFEYVFICQLDDRASYVYQSQYDKESKGVYFSVTIIKEGWYSFQIDKSPDRSLGLSHQESAHYQYPTAQFQLFYLTGQKVQSFGKIKPDIGARTFCRKYTLKAGKYLVFGKINFDQYERNFNVTLAIYGEYSCNIRAASQEQISMICYNQQQDKKCMSKPKIQIRHRYLVIEDESQKQQLQMQKQDQKQKNVQDGKKQQLNEGKQTDQKQCLQSKNVTKQISLTILKLIAGSKGMKKKVTTKTLKKTNIKTQKMKGQIIAKQTTNTSQKIIQNQYINRGGKKIKGEKQITNYSQIFMEGSSLYRSRTINENFKEYVGKNGETKRILECVEQIEYDDEETQSEDDVSNRLEQMHKLPSLKVDSQKSHKKTQGSSVKNGIQILAQLIKIRDLSSSSESGEEQSED